MDNNLIFNVEELFKFNGKDGNPAYVAVNGVVYDVTDNMEWKAVKHFGLTPGKDLTAEFFACHVPGVLTKLPAVGYLREE